MKKEGKEMEPFVKDFSKVIADSKRKWKKKRRGKYFDKKLVIK